MCGIYALPKVLYILIVQMDLPTFIQNQKESILAQKLLRPSFVMHIGNLIIIR